MPAIPQVFYGILGFRGYLSGGVVRGTVKS